MAAGYSEPDDLLGAGLGDLGSSAGAGSAFAPNADVLAMHRALMNEKASPEVLPYETQLVENLLDATRVQQRLLDGSTFSADDVVTAGLYQMDIDRVQYLVRAYLRARLFKIRVHASSIVADPEVFHSRLSRQERDFAAGFVALMHDHLSTSVLHKLPEKYRSLSDDRRMVEGPDLDVYVMCRASETIPDCVLDETGETHTFQEGDTVAVKYLVIRKPLFEKRFDLL